MKIKRSLDILGKQYKIRFRKNLKHSEDAWGLCDKDSRTITLDSSLKLEEQALLDTLLHELIHAIIGESEVILDDMQEEVIVSQITKVLLQLFLIKFK